MTVAEAGKAAEAAQAAGDAAKAKLLRSWLDAVARTKAAEAPRTKPSQNRPSDKQKRQRGRELTSR